MHAFLPACVFLGGCTHVQMFPYVLLPDGCSQSCLAVPFDAHLRGTYSDGLPSPPSAEVPAVPLAQRDGESGGASFASFIALTTTCCFLIGLLLPPRGRTALQRQGSTQPHQGPATGPQQRGVPAAGAWNTDTEEAERPSREGMMSQGWTGAQDRKEEGREQGETGQVLWASKGALAPPPRPSG